MTVSRVRVLPRWLAEGRYRFDGRIVTGAMAGMRLSGCRLPWPRQPPTRPNRGPDRYLGCLAGMSPWARADHVTSIVHDHTSILARVERKWNLPAMTHRDTAAADLSDFLDLDQPAYAQPPALAQPLAGPAQLACEKSAPGKYRPPARSRRADHFDPKAGQVPGHGRVRYRSPKDAAHSGGRWAGLLMTNSGTQKLPTRQAHDRRWGRSAA
jgi:hypothetical protein